jgi:MFS family permease
MVRNSPVERQRIIPPAVAIGAYFFVNGACYASWVPRLPEIKRTLDVSDTQLGLTLIGGMVGSLCMSFAFAPVIHRLGTRRATMVSSMLLALALPLIAFAPSAAVLFAALACLGTIDGFADVAVNSQGLQLQSQRTKSIVNRLHGTWSVGALSGGLVAGRCATADISVRSQLLVTSVVLFAVAFIAVRWLLPSQSSTSAPDLQTGAESTQPTNRTPWRVAALFVVAGAGAVLAEIPATEWSTLMIEERFRRSGGAASIGFIGFAAGMVIGRFVGDLVTDRLGTTRTRRLGGGLNAFGFLVACTMANLGVVICALVFAGVGSSWLNPLLVRRASEVFHGPRGPTLAGMGARMGILVGTPLMGRISDTFSRSTGLLVVGGGAALLMFAMRLPGDESN